MSAKKIKLRTSANAINAKVSGGKKKILPKLKVILANPYKPKNETLDGSNLSEFQNLILSEITSSGLSGRQYARQNNIHLGLGSSLRSIGNKKASCVLISQSIKPRFIIDQIGYLTKEKNSTVPVYIVEDWEKISEELFGVKSLIVAFPSNLSGNLEKWILQKTLPVQCNKLPIHQQTLSRPISTSNVNNELNLNSIYLSKSSNSKRSFVPKFVVKSKEKIVPSNQSKDWTGDYISFSNPSEIMEEMDIDVVDEEFRIKQDKALDALQKIVESTHKYVIENNQKGKTISNQKTLEQISLKQPSIEDEEWENDPFSKSYIGLDVHKIQPNPNQKKKNKKRKKKTKKVGK